jgi:hypothetical protein
MMLHEIEKQLLPNGKYRLTCVFCGDVRETIKANWVGECTRIHESTVIAEALKRKGVGECIHRGQVTGEVVTGCGCAVPDWQRQYYSCAIYEKCVLLQLLKLPNIKACQGCNPHSLKQLSNAKTQT